MSDDREINTRLSNEASNPRESNNRTPGPASLARALDAASAHPTGTPNRTQVALAERMAAWLEHHAPRPDREE